VSDELVGPLLDLLARRLRAEAESELAAFGLRPRHVIALTVLRDQGERSQSDLAESLGIDPTNLVALLNELEADELVERRRSPQDRRRHTVVLTTDGTRLLREIEHALSGLEKRLFSELNAKDRSALYGLLQRAASATCGSKESPAVVSGCVND
jgi:DNA-binding MarR family transcriptional regulator